MSKSSHQRIKGDRFLNEEEKHENNQPSFTHILWSHSGDNEFGDCCEYNLNTFDNSNDKTISLVKAYPNPFNPSINIIIDSPEVDFVELKVHDTKGQFIDVIFNGPLNVGTHNFIWNANSYSSGIYILNISSSTINQSQLIHYILI